MITVGIGMAKVQCFSGSVTLENHGVLHVKPKQLVIDRKHHAICHDISNNVITKNN